MGLFKLYLRCLRLYTLPTQVCTAGTVAATGDIVYQVGLERRQFSQVQWKNTGRMAFYGGIIFAPLSNRWHSVLARINLGSGMSGKIKTTVVRTLTDLTFFSPVSTSLFYSVQGAFEGRSFHTPEVGVDGEEPLQGIYERLEERLLPTWQKQVLVFGPANLINLGFVPIFARPPVMNVFSLGWNTYLASANARGNLAPADLDLEQKITDRDISTVAAEAL